MNNSKLVLFVICVFVAVFTAPLVTAAPRGGGGFSGGHHFASMPARGGQTFTRSGAGNFRTFNDRRFVNNRFVNNRFVNNRFVNNRFVNHRFVNNRSSVVFIGDFGFPWWWGWGWGAGWGWGYPYGYYGYGYPYGYGSPYGYGYGYGYGGNQYGGDYGYGNGYGQYGQATHSRVAELQRRLARAGYYHGSVDGILGPQTRRAIRAYERDHGYAS
jgi:Putative peptidoglycan binding domain